MSSQKYESNVRGHDSNLLLILHYLVFQNPMTSGWKQKRNQITHVYISVEWSVEQ